MILVLSDLWLPFPGGAERLIFNISRHLERAAKVHVITGYENARQFNLTYHPIGIGADHDAGWALIEALLRVTTPNVILTHHLYAHEFERELVETGIPLVQVVLNGKRIPEAAIAIYISKFVAKRAGDYQPQDYILTPPAFDDVIADSHGPYIGFIKPIKHKGVELVYAIAQAMPDRKFLILRGEWQDLEIIRDFPNVEFMEPVADIRDFYAWCRLMLMPSLSEDAGTVAQEATLNGLPCISSNIEGLLETNAGGILLDPYDLKAWLRNIEWLDDSRPYERVVRSQRSFLHTTDQGRVLDEFAADVMALGADAG